MSKDREITLERIENDAVTIDEGERALIVVAKLVDLYGDVMLPIFERFERELVNLYRQESARERARSLAKTGDLSRHRVAAETPSER